MCPWDHSCQWQGFGYSKAAGDTKPAKQDMEGSLEEMGSCGTLAPTAATQSGGSTGHGTSPILKGDT